MTAYCVTCKERTEKKIEKRAKHYYIDAERHGYDQIRSYCGVCGSRVDRDRDRKTTMRSMERSVEGALEGGWTYGNEEEARS